MRQTEKPDLTIFSAYYSIESKRLLEINHDFITRLNLAAKWIWVVADNSGGRAGGAPDPGKFIVIPGSPVPESVPVRMRGSYNHGMGLNKILPYAGSRYALILDPDFFILKNNWINHILSYMDRKGLVFFGAPYILERFGKYRYFPGVHCMFVDSGKVNLSEFDFTPQYMEIADKPKFEAVKKKTFWLKRLRKFFKKIIGGDRLKIGKSWDTASGIFKKFGREPSECAQPVFTGRLSFGRALVDKLMPERLSFIPKRKNYFTTKRFQARGYFDARGEGWEEYVWEDRPFGVHLRGNTWGSEEEIEKKIEKIRGAIQSLLDL